jgi:hypothetical protein
MSMDQLHFRPAASSTSSACRRVALVSLQTLIAIASAAVISLTALLLYVASPILPRLLCPDTYDVSIAVGSAAFR